MSNYIVDKLHSKDRNKILLELKLIYETHLHPRLNNSGTNAKELKEFDNNMYCYRCKRFLNLPQNLSDGCENISDWTEECMADLNFVQAIVWLKSATISMQDISIEQFHLAFHKQWENKPTTGEDCNSRSGSPIFEIHDADLKSISQLSNFQEGMNFGYSSNDHTDSSSVKILLDVLRKSREEKSKENGILVEENNSPSSFTSFQTLERSFSYHLAKSSKQQNTTLKNHIIWDSCEENSCSSKSDMFRDSQEGRENIKEVVLETKDVASISSDNNSNANSRDSIIVPNRITAADLSPQEDSAYDTYQLHAITQRNSMLDCTQREEDVIFLSQKIGNITPYRKDENLSDTCSLKMLSTDDVEFFDILENNLCSGNIRQVSLSSSRQKNHSSIHSEGREDFTEDDECTGSENKKKKLDLIREATSKEEEKISWEWLKFTIDTLNADEITFQSVKKLLLVFQNEKIAKLYMRLRCWKDTLEEQVVDAVLNFCNVFGATNKTNVCTQEIVRVVTSLLNKSIKTTEMNKITILTHQISIILQLCTSMQVCVEIINYLMEELKSYENILISLMNGKVASVHNIHNQLHIMFFALTSCLKEYRLVSSYKETNLYDEESIPSVIDLWKKQLNCKSIILKDNIQIREQRWLKIFSDFAAIAAKDFVLFAKKSRNLVTLLERK